jgi:hypothetical protein
MADLARHRAEPADLPEQPLGHLEPAAQIRWNEAADLVGEVEQHRAGFEHSDRLAAIGRRMVHQRGDLVVGRDRQELRLELLALAEIDRDVAVREAAFLEEQLQLEAVRRRAVVEVHHARTSRTKSWSAPPISRGESSWM